MRVGFAPGRGAPHVPLGDALPRATAILGRTEVVVAQRSVNGLPRLRSNVTFKRHPPRSSQHSLVSDRRHWPTVTELITATSGYRRDWCLKGDQADQLSDQCRPPRSARTCGVAEALPGPVRSEHNPHGFPPPVLGPPAPRPPARARSRLCRLSDRLWRIAGIAPGPSEITTVTVTVFRPAEQYRCGQVSLSVRWKQRTGRASSPPCAPTRRHSRQLRQTGTNSPHTCITGCAALRAKPNHPRGIGFWRPSNRPDTGRG